MEGLNMKQLIVCKALEDREKQKEINKFEEYYEYEFDQELGFMIHYYDLQCSINLEDFFRYTKSGYIIISLGQALILALKLCQHLIEIHEKQITLGKISNQHIWINLEGISKRIQCRSFQQLYFRVQFVNFQNDFTKDEDFNHFKHIIFEIFYSLQKQLQSLNGYQENVKLVLGLLDALKKKLDLLYLFKELKQLNFLVNQQSQLHKNEVFPYQSTASPIIYQYLEKNIQYIDIQESQTFTCKYLKCLLLKIKSMFLFDQMNAALKDYQNSALGKTEFEYFNNLVSQYQLIFNSLENNLQFNEWFLTLQDQIKLEFSQKLKIDLELDQEELKNVKENYLKFQIYTVASKLKLNDLRESPKIFLLEIEKIQNETVKPFVEKIYKQKIKELVDILITQLVMDLM